MDTIWVIECTQQVDSYSGGTYPWFTVETDEGFFLSEEEAQARIDLLYGDKPENYRLYVEKIEAANRAMVQKHASVPANQKRLRQSAILVAAGEEPLPARRGPVLAKIKTEAEFFRKPWDADTYAPIEIKLAKSPEV